MKKRFVTKVVTEVCVDYTNNGDEVWKRLWGIFDKQNNGFVLYKDGDTLSDVDRAIVLEKAKELEGMSEEAFQEGYIIR